ncbi:MAG: hypothetical protein V8Q91_16550 [Bilophila wadsworthia]
MGRLGGRTAPACVVVARGPLLGPLVIDTPTLEQREEGWKAGLLDLGEIAARREARQIRPDSFTAWKPLPIPANFGRVLQRAL